MQLAANLQTNVEALTAKITYQDQRWECTNCQALGPVTVRRQRNEQMTGTLLRRTARVPDSIERHRESHRSDCLSAMDEPLLTHTQPGDVSDRGL
jgi:hypothetical protein